MRREQPTYRNVSGIMYEVWNTKFMQISNQIVYNMKYVIMSKNRIGVETFVIVLSYVSILPIHFPSLFYVFFLLSSPLLSVERTIVRLTGEDVWSWSDDFWLSCWLHFAINLLQQCHVFIHWIFTYIFLNQSKKKDFWAWYVSELEPD